MCNDDKERDQLPETPEPIESFDNTIPSEPPERPRLQRRSWWPPVFAEARALPGEWRLVVSAFSKSTACQIASDVRSAYKRDPKKMRIRGIFVGEQWEARCAPAPKVVSDEVPVKEPWWIWVRFVGEKTTE